METSLWTVHIRDGQAPEVIPDRFDVFALVLPVIWMIWYGTWATLAVAVAVLTGAFFYSPFAVMPLMYAIAALLAFEGGACRRLELRVRGWREAALVEAASAEGAEEAYLNGNRVRTA